MAEAVAPFSEPSGSQMASSDIDQSVQEALEAFNKGYNLRRNPSKSDMSEEIESFVRKRRRTMSSSVSKRPRLDHENENAIAEDHEPEHEHVQEHQVPGDVQNGQQEPQQSHLNEGGADESEADAYTNLGDPSASGQYSWNNTTSFGNYGENPLATFEGFGQDGFPIIDMDVSLHLKIQSMPILDNLATQLLRIFAKTSHQDVLKAIAEPESEVGKVFSTLKALFEQTKKIYSDEEPFLDGYVIGMTDDTHMDTIRKTNLATWVSSVFGSNEVGFYHLNEHFLDTFIPEGGRLLKRQGNIYLDLKTQAYISAMSSGETSREETAEDLFPGDLADRILARRSRVEALTQSETDFINQASQRRADLLSEPDNVEAINALPGKYLWENFLSETSGYIAHNFEAIIAPATRKITRNKQIHGLPMQDMQSQFQQSEPAAAPEQPAYDENDDDIVAKAAAAAQVALQGDFFSQDDSSSQPMQSHEQQQPQYSLQQAMQDVHQQHQSSQLDPNHQVYGTTEIPYPSQSAPTQVLYERARLAATAKSSPNNRRAGLPSQRRPWTTEEENALMAGLDRVKGPHWSQILAMFGPGGTINETLKDRNQVQLKDKARNLKLFFLKSGIEVPYYLQFVTGELKTRAPAQAAKNEARERARQQGAEDKAHVEGIMALANGAAMSTATDDGAAAETNAAEQAAGVPEGRQYQQLDVQGQPQQYQMDQQHQQPPEQQQEYYPGPPEQQQENPADQPDLKPNNMSEDDDLVNRLTMELEQDRNNEVQV